MRAAGHSCTRASGPPIGLTALLVVDERDEVASTLPAAAIAANNLGQVAHRRRKWRTLPFAPLQQLPHGSRLKAVVYDDELEPIGIDIALCHD
jgi:hypothetical protein